MKDYNKYGLEALHSEINSLKNLEKTISSEIFSNVCKLIIESKQKIIFMGIGKSGHIANKISASLSSTGTPSFFVHPTEACHGNAGIFQQHDIVVYISNSGEAIEFSSLLNLFKKLEIKIIAITNNMNSTLAKNSDYCLNLEVETEACPINLAPTSSTTNTLVLGDALTIALLKKRNFQPHNFAQSHPFGRLGKRLLLTIKEIMSTNDNIPIKNQEESIFEIIFEITKKRLGAVIIVNNENQAVGIFTDGDLRRLIATNQDLNKISIKDVMIKSFHHINSETLAVEALDLLNSKGINFLPIIDNNVIVGAIHMHDILKSGI